MNNDEMLNLAELIVDAGLHKTNKQAREFVSEVYNHLKPSTTKRAYFNMYSGSGLKESKSFFMYVAWSYLVASGQVSIEPSSNLSPADLASVTRELSADPNALNLINQAWGGGGGGLRRRRDEGGVSSQAKKQWAKFMEASTSSFSSEDHMNDMFELLFMKSHGANISATRSAWNLVSNSGASDLSGAIKSLGSYVTRFMSLPTKPKSKEVVTEVSESMVESVSDQIDRWRPMAPSKYVEIASLLEANDELALKAFIAEYVDEDWALAVSSFWDEDLLFEIVEISSETSSKLLAPLVIKNFKFLSLGQLDDFTTFIDKCMSKDNLGAGYVKDLKKHTRSVAQWVNLYLAVSGGFSNQGVTIKGELHGGGGAWASALIDIADEASNPRSYLESLWNACEDYLPVQTMSLSKADFITVLESFLFKYSTLKGSDPSKAKKKFKDYFKGGYFKSGSDKYPQALIANPMAEAVRVRLLLAIIPDEFESQLDDTAMVSCKDLIESILEIPESVLEVVRDETSDVVVDHIIADLEEAVMREVPLNEQIGGGS